MMRRILFTFSLFTFLTSLSAQTNESLIKTITINFETNNHRIKKQDLTYLNEALASLEPLHIYRFVISGHTDNVGSLQSNKRLSEKRANALSTYLIGKGVDKATIEINSFGFDQPVGDNNFEEGRKQNRRTELHIFLNIAPIIPVEDKIRVSGIVSSLKNGNLANQKISFKVDGIEQTATSDGGGNYTISLNPNKKYSVSTSLIKHFSYNEQLNIGKESKKLNITLVPIEENQTVTLKSIEFENNKALLRDKSAPTLQKMMEQMRLEKNVCFEIQGHVNAPMMDVKVEDQYTTDLSLARALNIYDFLTKNGIAEERMTVKGLGHSKMLFPKAATTDEHLANMRVDLKTLSCEEIKILKLSENKVNFDRIRSSTYFK